MHMHVHMHMHAHMHMHMHMHMHVRGAAGAGAQLGSTRTGLGRRGAARYVSVAQWCLQVWRRPQLLLVFGLREGRRGEARDTGVERRREHAWLGLGLGARVRVGVGVRAGVRVGVRVGG